MVTFLKNFGTGMNVRASAGWLLIKTAITKWWATDPFRQSAVIAYYAIFSLPALLVIIVTVAGLALGADAVNGKINEQIKATMGTETADQIKLMLAKASETKTSVWATILGVVTVILGSMGVFLELQKTLNIIWEVKEKPQKGIWGFLRARVFSFGLILSISFMLMISLVVSTGLASASDLLRADSSKFLAFLFEGINFIISLGVISFLFSLMFKFLPDAKIKWMEVWIGGLVTGILFTLGKTALAFYFGKASPGSGYGAAGSIVLILLWVSYSSMILFLGAEFTHTYADMRSGEGAKDTLNPDKGDKDATDKVLKSSSGYLKLVPFILPLLSLFNMGMPFLVRFIIKRIAKKNGIRLDFKKLSISLLKSQISMEDLSASYGNDTSSETSFSITMERIWLDYKPSSFFRGLLDIQNLTLKSPLITVIQGIAITSTESQQSTKPGGPLPVIVHHFMIDDGRVGFKNPHTDPITEIIIDHVILTCSSNGQKVLELTPLTLNLRAELLEGTLWAQVIIQPQKMGMWPSFTMRLELSSLNLVALNNFFLAYAKIDVHTGTLDLFAEATADKGRIKGYVKPLIKNLEFLGPEDREKGIVTQFKERTAQVVKTMLENPFHQQVATEVPFEGKLKNPNIYMAHAILAAGINIFIHALRPGFNPLLSASNEIEYDWYEIV